MSRNVVLIIGDFIIDRTWVVGEPSLAEQHNSHYEVHPRNLVEPYRNPDVAGGIGTIARALSAIKSGLRIMAVGAWSEYVSVELKSTKPVRGLIPPDDLNAEDVPEQERVEPSPIEFHQIVETPFTNLKSRFYRPTAGGALLEYRFDRNASTVPDIRNQPACLPIDWPDPNDVALVILGDYGYGVLQLDEVARRAAAYAKTADVMLRSYDETIIDRYQWNLLTLNLHLFALYLDRVRGAANRVTAFDPPVIRDVAGKCAYHPLLIQALNSAPIMKSKRHPVLINLEREGAIVVQEGAITPLMLSVAGERLNIGIGANDVALAHIAAGLLSTSGTFDERLHASAGRAVRAGSVFADRSRQLDLVPGWYAPKLAVSAGEIEKAPPLVDPVGTTRLKEQLDVIREANRVSKSSVRLHHASWYLDGFVTADTELGEGIVRLKRGVAAAIRDDRTRPFVAALCGDPGAGKTTLAQRIGDSAGCEVIIENVAQWTSVDNLFGACERIRTARMRGRIPLAFIDEVDSLLENQPIYGKLLAPIWDGAYFVHGQERTLGHPTIFLLAGSTATWRTSAALLKAGRANRSDKLPDLVSRLSMVPLEIRPLEKRQADVVYMAASHIVRKFPRVREADGGIFRLFTESKLRHGARSIATVLDLFQPPIGTRLRTSDLRDDKDLALHIDDVLTEWREDATTATIEP